MGQALKAHLPSLWRFALSLTRSADQAEDLVQATCLRAMERHAQFDGSGRLEAWLITICRSIWLNQLRGEAIRATRNIDTVSEAQLAALGPAAETNIFASEVFAEMMRLPQAQRETVVLVFVEGFKYSEAAAILGVPIGTVMSRLSAARKRLARLNEATEHGGRREGTQV